MVECTEVNMFIGVNGKSVAPPRGLRPWHVEHSEHTATREILRSLAVRAASMPDN